MIKWKGLIAPTEVPTGDGRMFAAGKLTHRPTPMPLLARFSSGGHDGATVVGKVNSVFQGPGGYWAEGEFLDPSQVPEVPKAIYMLQQKVMGPSVDLDRDFTVEAIKHPTRPDRKAGLFKEYNVIGVTLVPMPAFHQVHMSVDSEPEKALLASAGVDTSTWPPFFDVNHHSWRNWPLAPRNYQYDADDAVKRIAYWAGIGSKQPSIDRYASTFLWRNGNQTGDSLAQDSFRLPLADIINNEPHLIYHAVYAAAALLSGAHGGLPNIPAEDRQAMVPIINEIYFVLARAFNDPDLKSPFLKGVPQSEIAAEQHASINSEEEDCGCSDMSTININVADGNFTFPTVDGETYTIGPDGEFTGKRTPKTPYGPKSTTNYADPGYQADGVARYPLDTETHVRAAWAYINKENNASQYTAEQLKAIKMRIAKAMKTHGIEMDEQAAKELQMATLAASKTPYGAKVTYADPGYQEDGVKRYPLDSQAHCVAAWRYINMERNASKYDPEQLATIKDRIRQALKKYGIDAQDQPNQMAMDFEDLEDEDESGSLLAGAAPLAPPAEWFTNPDLKAPTKLTISDDGHVFGHLAQWKVCHVGIGNQCVMAPRSRTGYQLFRVGSVVCDDGSMAPIGKITLGTGHAHAQWGVVPSRQHYDNTGWAAAVVNVGEDQHGIWVNGALTTTMTPERTAELRAAALSGDWREVNGNLELIAALAVNNPGFPIYREQNNRAFSLMAVGVIGQQETEFSMSDTENDEVVETEEEDADPELSARLERWEQIEQELEAHNQARRAAQLAAIDAERQAMVQGDDSTDDEAEDPLFAQYNARLQVMAEPAE